MPVPPHGDSQSAKPTHDGTMAGTRADLGASTNEGAGTSESASATTTNEPASETPSSSDSDSDSDSDSSSELPEWTHLEKPTTGTCPLCLGRRTLPWSAHDQRTNTDVAVCGRCHAYHDSMRRMIAPSCSSLGPDGRMPRRREPLVECLLLGWLQHSATPRQFAIKQSSSAHWPWPGGADSLARSLSEACTLSASLSEAK